MKKLYKKIIIVFFVLILLEQVAALFGVLGLYYIILKVACLPAGLIILVGYLVDQYKNKHKGEKNEE